MSYTHVVLVGVDGLGGWYLQQLGESMPTRAPHLAQMLRDTYKINEANDGQTKNLCAHPALAARTAFPPVSAPVWATILSGDTIANHGVDSNHWPERAPTKRSGIAADFWALPPCDLPPLRSKVMRGSPIFSVCGRRPWTVVDELVSAGRTAHVAVAWSWLMRLFNDVSSDSENNNNNTKTKKKKKKINSSNSSNIDISNIASSKKQDNSDCKVKVINGAGDDAKCVDDTCAALGQYDFLFLHLDMVDKAGHRHGWGSPLYFEAVKTADAEIGRVMHAATETQAPVLVIVCSDHGGAGRSHGAMQKSDMLVPLILWATNGIGEICESQREMTVMDIAPTVLTALGVAPPCWMSGVSRIPCKTRDASKE